MTKFEWTPEQRAKLVPGAKVITFTSVASHGPVFYTVHRPIYTYGGVDYVVFDEPSIDALVNEECLRNAAHRLDHCDPSTIEAPASC